MVHHVMLSMVVLKAKEQCAHACFQGASRSSCDVIISDILCFLSPDFFCPTKDHITNGSYHNTLLIRVLRRGLCCGIDQEKGF